MSQLTKNKTPQTAGFTLIELMLSMTFVAVLLVTIAMTIIQMSTIYNRGMTLKEVNQAGRDVSEDVRRSISQSQIFAVNTDGSDSADYVTVKNGSNIIGGRLCTGAYSYVWNIATAIEQKDVNLTQTLTAGGKTESPVRFVKIPDINKKYCLKDTNGIVNKHIIDDDASTMTNLLDVGDHNLTLVSLNVTTNDKSFDVSTGQRLYTMNYTIGSGLTSAMNLQANPIVCLPPNDPNSNLTYCNVQQFAIVLRVGNTVN